MHFCEVYISAYQGIILSHMYMHVHVHACMPRRILYVLCDYILISVHAEVSQTHTCACTCNMHVQTHV